MDITSSSSKATTFFADTDIVITLHPPHPACVFPVAVVSTTWRNNENSISVLLNPTGPLVSEQRILQGAGRYDLQELKATAKLWEVAATVAVLAANGFVIETAAGLLNEVIRVIRSR